jgi:hypothetical protein
MLYSKDMVTESPSKTYVIPIYQDGFKRIKFKQFILPDKYKTYGATWYFYNRLDIMSCGGSAYPIEYHNNVEKIKQ